MGTSARSLPVISVVQVVTQLQVLLLALVREPPLFTSHFLPPLAQFCARVFDALRPPASPRKLPLARRLQRLRPPPPPRSRFRSSAQKAQAAEPRPTAAGQSSSRKRPLFPGIPMPCGTVEGSSGLGGFPDFFTSRLPFQVRVLRGAAGSDGGAP